MRRHPAAFAILAGTAAAGTLDITYAVVFSGFHGVPARRILQSVASGLLGKPAFDGGAPTAALGLALHYGIMAGMAAAFYAISARVPALRARPLLWGPLYGLGLYAAMSFVVLPLSAYPYPVRFSPAYLLAANLIVHMAIGLIIAALAGYARRR
ncbi:MAG TPA: hypothetical protein VFA75_11755 [Nevskia sp.]|jgi:hypothetical protein|nr:hypothetical protein [Nevskia sp.]